MTNSLHSPKNKFRMEINFNEPVDGIGSVISYTSNSIRGLSFFADKYRNAHVVIMKNLKEYPKFEWVKVESYNI